MNLNDFYLSCYVGMLLGLLLILAGMLWQLVTAPRTVCKVCRESTRGAELVGGLCWACQRNVALLVPDGPADADEVPLPAWLVSAVNAAGKHIPRNRL